MIDAADSLSEVHRLAGLGLRLRALDARSPRPVLGDRAAAAVADTLGLDPPGPRPPRALAVMHAAWTGTLDDIVRRFVAAHPDAVVLDLGCGFDPRVLRCRPPATVSWFGVDLPPVAALRRRVVTGPEEVLAADVTVPGWMAALPRDRPLVAIADGLMPLLPDAEFRDLAREITGHAPAGEFAFLGYGRLAMRNSRRVRLPGLSVPTRATGIDDAREPETWDARLVLREEIARVRPEYLARFPTGLRAVAAVSQRSPRIARLGGRILHYGFG